MTKHKISRIKLREDKLHQLILSLSPTEKGYVSKRFKIHGSGSNIALLFKILSNMEKYDESILQKKIKNKTLLKNLPVTKKMLYDAILKHLRSYHSSKSQYVAVLNLLRDIDFLFEKQILSECKSLISKGLLLCNKLNLHALKIHFLDWEKRILNIKQHDNAIEKDIHDNNLAIKKIMEDIEISQELELNQLLLHHHLFHKKWSTKNTDELGKFIQDLEEKVKEYHHMSLDENPRANMALIDIISRIEFKKGKVDSSREIIKKGLENYDYNHTHPLSIEKLQRLLLVSLGLHVMEQEECNIILQQLEQLRKRHPFLKQNNHTELIINTYKIQWGYLTGNHIDNDVIAILEAAVESSFSQMPMASWISFHISRYYFTNGYFKDAHIWNLKALNQPKNNAKNFIYICKFHSLMILLENENYNMVEQNIDDLLRFIKRRKHITLFEKDIIELFKSAVKNWNKSSYILFQEKFKSITKKHQQEIDSIFFYLDIPSWIKSKEKGMTVFEFKNCKKTL